MQKNAMKRNWIRGFDRLAILCAVPIAIFGGYYSSKAFTQSHGVCVWISSDEEAELKAPYYAVPEKKRTFLDIITHTQIFGFPNEYGVIADGEKELDKIAEKHPVAKLVLQRAFADGADPCGSLVKYKDFKFDHVPDDEMAIIPKKSKRYMFGLLGGLGSALGFVLGIGLATRGMPKLIRLISRLIRSLFRWLYRGFKADN